MQSEALIAFTAALFERSGELSIDEIENMIFKSEDAKFRKMVLQMYFDVCKDRSLDSKLKESLTTMSTEEQVVLVQHLKYSKEELEALFQENQGDVAFWALRMLSQTDKSKALQIAQEVLANEQIEKEDTKKIHIAILLKSESLRENNNRKEIDGFIKLCEGLLKKEEIEKTDLKDVITNVIEELK